jgi:uncharacterized protein
LKLTVSRLIAVGIILLLCGLTILVCRNYQLELGARALGDDRGKDAVDHFRPLAEFGDSKAQFLMGNIYAYGWGGVKKNDDEAIYWFRRAAVDVKDEADPAAPAELAIAKSYADGTGGVKQDKAESIKWLRLSAAGWNKEAVTLLSKRAAPQN